VTDRRLRGAVAGGTLLVLLATALAGCVHYRSPPEQALSEATRSARDKAERGRQVVEVALRSSEAEDPPAALELGRTGFKETVGSDGLSRVLESSSQPDGSVQFDLAIVGGGETGGGLTYAATTVLLCARLTATPGRDARAVIADLPCPSGLTSKGGPLYGQVNQVVTLKG
jgi:hypothetical protein